MFVDIPPTLANSIPGLRDSTVLPRLKRVRQKITNKLKFARAQLKHQKQIPKVDDSSFLNNVNFISNKETKQMNRIPNNIINDNNCMLLSEKYNQSTSLINNNLTKSSNLQPLFNVIQIPENENNKSDRVAFNNINCNYDRHKNNNSDDKISNDEKKSSQSHVQYNDLLSSKPQFVFENPQCTTPTLNLNSKKNDKIGCLSECVNHSSVYTQNTDSSITKKCKL